MKQTGLIALALLAGGSLARADEVVLTNGHTIKNARRLESKDPNRVIIEVGAGRIELDAKQVSAVNPGQTPLHEYDGKYSAIKDSRNAADFWKLAVWAKENKLTHHAAMLSERVLQLDPSNEAAHKELGHEKIDGTWYTYEKAMEKKGFVLLEDRWLTKAEVQLIEKRRLEAREREAAQKAEREREKREEKERRERDLVAYNDWMSKQLAGLDGYFYQPSEFWPAYFRPYPWATYVRSRRYYQEAWTVPGAGGGLGTFDLFRFIPSPFAK
jgi:hypothetical protein